MSGHGRKVSRWWPFERPDSFAGAFLIGWLQGTACGLVVVVVVAGFWWIA